MIFNNKKRKEGLNLSSNNNIDGKLIEESISDTKTHIDKVASFINLIISGLNERVLNHDKSKMEQPELDIFAIYGPKLKDSTYGSEEYRSFLKEMKVALDSHYSKNRHHPEFYDKKEKYCTECGYGLNNLNNHSYYNKCPNCNTSNPEIKERYTLRGMNLIDLVEMICDWKAASMRHNNGDIYKSVIDNKERFGISDELSQILFNTVKLFDN